MTAWCEMCQRNVIAYIGETNVRTLIIRNVKVHAVQRYCFCNECGSLVLPTEIDKINTDQIEEAYKTKIRTRKNRRTRGMAEAPVTTNENGKLVAILPDQIESLALPDPSLLMFYHNMDKRRLWVDFEITDQLVEYSKFILQWNAEDRGVPIEDREPIWVFINTPGGDLYPTFNFIDVCLASKTPVFTVNAGVCFSGGAIILLAGQKRYALPHSRVLIHTGSGGTEGTFEQTESALAHYKTLVSDMGEFILSRTKIDQKLFKKKKAQDWYIDAKECVALGVVDKVIEDLDEVLG